MGPRLASHHLLQRRQAHFGPAISHCTSAAVIEWNRRWGATRGARWICRHTPGLCTQLTSRAHAARTAGTREVGPARHAVAARRHGVTCREWSALAGGRSFEPAAATILRAHAVFARGRGPERVLAVDTGSRSGSLARLRRTERRVRPVQPARQKACSPAPVNPATEFTTGDIRATIPRFTAAAYNGSPCARFEGRASSLTTSEAPAGGS
jgi:hypothetical protein